jgi:hypothetical protein
LVNLYPRHHIVKNLYKYIFTGSSIDLLRMHSDNQGK